MKPQEFAYTLAVALFRLAAVGMALFGLFMVISPMLMMGAGGMSLMFLRVVVVYFGAAAVLWLIAKPVASLVSRDLDKGRSS
jgi:hypothetical protein